MSLSDKNRTALKEFIFDAWRESLFGRHMVEDYIKYGINIRGIEAMSDQELINEGEDLRYIGYPDEENLLDECVAEMEMHNLLKQECNEDGV